MFKTKTERSEEYKNEAKRKETLHEQLISATRLGFLDVVKGLVKMGAEIRDTENQPILHAAFYGRANIAKYFLSEGGFSPIADRHLIELCISRATHMFSSEDENTALVFINFLLLDTVKTKLKPSLTHNDFCLCLESLMKCRFPGF